MPTERTWKLYYASLGKAAQEGEDIARTYQFNEPPVDPLLIVEREKELIHAEGYDFQNSFDGRIKYVGPRFLICFNTKYNKWPHSGKLHSKIIFTIAHELGHFFLPKHREYLVTSRTPHGSFTEFTADPLVEKQADYFASGLLMPSFLLRRFINKKNFVSVEEFHEIRQLFQVSLTGMLVRWTELSDFPCATIAIQNGRILFGWTSKALRDCGAYSILKGKAVNGKDVTKFIKAEPKLSYYRHGVGAGALSNWIDFEGVRMSTDELFFAIPHTNTVWVLATADESDLEYDWD